MIRVIRTLVIVTALLIAAPRALRATPPDDQQAPRAPIAETDDPGTEMGTAFFECAHCESLSQRRRRRRSRGTGGSPRRRGASTSIPLDIGIGPTFNFITGPVQADQLAHFGLRLNLQAVIDKETIARNMGRVPRKYRGLAKNTDEVRVKPLLLNLVPREFIVSPKIWDTSMYGVGWNLIGVGFAPISDPVRVSLSTGLLAKYMYISSETLPTPTHFLRPGLELMLDIEFPLSRDFLVSFGWASQVYVPQPVGGSILDVLPLDDAIWHVGQAFLKLHFRVPFAM